MWFNQPSSLFTQQRTPASASCLLSKNQCTSSEDAKRNKKTSSCLSCSSAFQTMWFDQQTAFFTQSSIVTLTMWFDQRSALFTQQRTPASVLSPCGLINQVCSSHSKEHQHQPVTFFVSTSAVYSRNRTDTGPFWPHDHSFIEDLIRFYFSLPAKWGRG
jgi:hypothetical protein